MNGYACKCTRYTLLPTKWLKVIAWAIPGMGRALPFIHSWLQRYLYNIYRRKIKHFARSLGPFSSVLSNLQHAYRPYRFDRKILLCNVVTWIKRTQLTISIRSHGMKVFSRNLRKKKKISTSLSLYIRSSVFFYPAWIAFRGIHAPISVSL